MNATRSSAEKSGTETRLKRANCDWVTDFFEEIGSEFSKIPISCGPCDSAKGHPALVFICIDSSHPARDRGW